MTERMWDAIESSPYAMAEFLRDYTGYTLDVIEDYDEPDISPDNYIVGERLVLAGVIQVEGRLIGLTGTVSNGVLTITVSSKSDTDPGDDTHEFDGGVVNGVLGVIVSNVSGSGVLGPIIGSVSSAGVLSILGSSSGGGSGGGGEVTGDVLKVTGSVSSGGTLSVTGVVQGGVLSVSGSSTPGGGGGSNVPVGNATGVYGDVLRLNGSTKIEGTVVNNTLNITI